MDFSYREPSSLQEAVLMMEEAVSDHKTVRYLAGGTDLFPLLKRDVMRPDMVINLKHIEGLDGIEEDASEVRIGSLVSLHQISRSEVLKEWAPALQAASDRAATPALRNMGTIGGNLFQTGRCPYFNQSGQFRAGVAPCYSRGGHLCHKDSESRRCIRILMSELVPPLIAEEAQAVLYSSQGERIVPLRELYDVRLFSSKIRRGEILTQIRIPKKSGNWRECYERMAARKTIDYPAVNMGIRVEMDSDGCVCRSIQCVFGSVGCGPMILEKTGRFLEGNGFTERVILEAADLAVEEITPYAVASLEFPVWYRLEMVRKMLRDALMSLTRAPQDPGKENAETAENAVHTEKGGAEEDDGICAV